MIDVQRPILVEVRDVAPHDRVRRRHADAVGEVAEVERLGRGHELDAQDAVGVLEDLPGLEGRVHAHRHEVFLVGGRRDRLDGGGRGEDALLDDQRVGRVLAEHQPENMPAPRVRKAGSPALRAGLVSRLRRRSERTQTIVTAVPTISIGRETGVPWKLAPVSVSRSSGRKMGLSPTPLSSISTCGRA